MILAKLKPDMWGDDDFHPLDDAQKVVFFWLLSCQTRNSIGYVEVSRRALLADTGKTPETLLSLLKSLPRGFHWDEVNGRIRVLILNFVRHQFAPGQFGRKSYLVTHLCRLFDAMPESFQAAFEVSYKGLVRDFIITRSMEGASKSLPRDKEKSKHREGEGEGIGKGGGPGEGSEIPGDEAVLAYAAGYQDLARGILDGIPAGYALQWLAWRSTPKAGAFPRDWQADLRRRFTGDRLQGDPRAFAATEGGDPKKNAPKKNGASSAQRLFALDKELAELEGRLRDCHELNQPGDPGARERVAELKKQRKELE